MTDASSGYETFAQELIATRHRSRVGVGVVRAWTALLPPGATVLDVGCGAGVPLAEALHADGFQIYGIDASPTLAGAFRARLPDSHIACEDARTSHFFGRTFDGVLAVGLLFLLSAEDQRALLRRLAAATAADGRILFSAPGHSCLWKDVLTGRESRSLGAVEYAAVLADAGMEIAHEYDDEGQNHYYDCQHRLHD